jgi:hypothetical protein
MTFQKIEKIQSLIISLFSYKQRGELKKMQLLIAIFVRDFLSVKCDWNRSFVGKKNAAWITALRSVISM